MVTGGCRRAFLLPRKIDDPGTGPAFFAQHVEFKREHPGPATGKDYVNDHIKPLACGGADAPGKAKWERKGVLQMNVAPPLRLYVCDISKFSFGEWTAPSRSARQNMVTFRNGGIITEGIARFLAFMRAAARYLNVSVPI